MIKSVADDEIYIITIIINVTSRFLSLAFHYIHYIHYIILYSLAFYFHSLFQYELYFLKKFIDATISVIFETSVTDFNMNIYSTFCICFEISECCSHLKHLFVEHRDCYSIKYKMWYLSITISSYKICKAKRLFTNF